MVASTICPRMLFITATNVLFYKLRRQRKWASIHEIYYPKCNSLEQCQDLQKYLFKSTRRAAPNDQRIILVSKGFCSTPTSFWMDIELEIWRRGIRFIQSGCFYSFYLNLNYSYLWLMMVVLLLLIAYWFGI